MNYEVPTTASPEAYPDSQLHSLTFSIKQSADTPARALPLQHSLRLKPGAILPFLHGKEQQAHYRGQLPATASADHASNRHSLGSTEMLRLFKKEENYLLGQFSNYITQKYLLRYLNF